MLMIAHSSFISVTCTLHSTLATRLQLRLRRANNGVDKSNLNGRTSTLIWRAAPGVSVSGLRDSSVIRSV